VFLIFQEIMPFFADIPWALFCAFTSLLVLPPFVSSKFYAGLSLSLIADFISVFDYGVFAISFLVLYILVQLISDRFNFEYNNFVTMFLKSGIIFVVYLVLLVFFVIIIGPGRIFEFSSLKLVYYYKMAVVLILEFGFIFLLSFLFSLKNKDFIL